ncbi:MAG: hypothetical protein ACRYF5_11595, partial [Janthinobacterium lividum]
RSLTCLGFVFDANDRRVQYFLRHGTRKITGLSTAAMLQVLSENGVSLQDLDWRTIGDPFAADLVRLHTMAPPQRLHMPLGPLVFLAQCVTAIESIINVHINPFMDLLHASELGRINLRRLVDLPTYIRNGSAVWKPLQFDGKPISLHQKMMFYASILMCLRDNEIYCRRYYKICGLDGAALERLTAAANAEMVYLAAQAEAAIQALLVEATLNLLVYQSETLANDPHAVVVPGALARQLAEVAGLWHPLAAVIDASFASALKTRTLDERRGNCTAREVPQSVLKRWVHEFNGLLRRREYLQPLSAATAAGGQGAHIDYYCQTQLDIVKECFARLLEDESV